MHALTGYADRWSVQQGETIRFMVSSAAGRDFGLRVCPSHLRRSQSGWTGLRGSRNGERDRRHACGQGTACLISAASAMSRRCRSICAAGCRLSATIWPTTPGKVGRVLIALRIGDWTFALGIGPNGGAMAEVAGPDGAPTVRAEVPRRLLERRWYDVTAELGIDGAIVVKQMPHAPLGDAGEAHAKVTTRTAGAPEIFLAALPPEGDEPAGCALQWQA